MQGKKMKRTKGWFNQKGEKDYAIYIENYDWIDTWLSLKLNN